MEELKERMAKIEGNMEQMNQRLNHVETDLRALRQTMDQRFDSLYHTMLLILIPMWVTITGFLIGILMKI
jgi:predicted  nucleic acid-binding Zn-ribbon protein